MCGGEDVDGVVLDEEDDVVGEVPKGRTADDEVRREVGHERGGFRPLLDAGEHVLRRVEESQTQARMLLLVPVGGFSSSDSASGCSAMRKFTRR